MARKKAEEVKEVEIIDTPVVEEVVETPKKSKKSSKKDEEPVVEEVKVDEPVVEAVSEPVVEEVKPEPVKVKKEKKVDAPAKDTKSSYMVVAKTTLNVIKAPGRLNLKVGTYKAGIKLEVIEEKIGWGKVAEGKWINLNYVEKV